VVWVLVGELGSAQEEVLEAVVARFAAQGRPFPDIPGELASYLCFHHRVLWPVAAGAAGIEVGLVVDIAVDMAVDMAADKSLPHWAVETASPLSPAD
jgi:hypothetical protein